MAYTKTTLISRPIPDSYGIGGVESALGLDWSSIKTGASSALDFFGAGLKAQGGQEALQQALKNQQPPPPAAGGIPTTYLIVGGLAIAGLLVFAMRGRGPRKNPFPAGVAYLSPPDARNRPIMVRKRAAQVRSGRR